MIILYADDILLYLQSPSISLLQSINLINYFSNSSDYIINWSKSTTLPLNLSGWDLAGQTTPLSLKTEYIKYL